VKEEGGGGCICTGELRLVAVDGSDGAAQDDGEEQTQELDDDDAEAGAQNVRLVVFLPLEQFLCATLRQNTPFFIFIYLKLFSDFFEIIVKYFFYN
jgi:hypothetical protein